MSNHKRPAVYFGVFLALVFCVLIQAAIPSYLHQINYSGLFIFISSVIVGITGGLIFKWYYKL